MGNSLNCTSSRSKKSRSKHSDSFKSYMPADGLYQKQVAPDLLPHNAREHRASQQSSPAASPSPVNNNDKSEVFTFEKAFRLSQLGSSPTNVVASKNSQQLQDSSSEPNNKRKYDTGNCYVNIKPFIHPLPPVPAAVSSEELRLPYSSDSEIEPIPPDEYTPPVLRKPPPRLPSGYQEEEEVMDSPKLPPRPGHLVLSQLISDGQTTNQTEGLSDEESIATTPLPRKSVGFMELSLPADTSTDTADMSVVSNSPPSSELGSSVIKKRPRKPPRNFSYKASTLPKRISHTTEEVMQLWDEVRKTISLEKLNENTASILISEDDDEDIDEIYQNLYAARMRSWQIMCLAQDVLVARMKPERIWACFRSEFLVSEDEYKSLCVESCTQRDSNQLIIDRILEHGDGWFDRLREVLRNHEDQKQIANLLDALNDVFIIGAKANKWTFSLTTKHCTVQQARPRSISDQPDLIGDTAEGLQPVILLEVYEENFGNASCASLADVLRRYNVISQLNIGKNRITSKGIAKLVSGIEGNRCLEKLNLRLNPIGNGGLELLTKALEKNNSVKEVILCHTQLKDGCGEAISSLLRNNSSIETLDLSFNDLTDHDCMLICQALENNSRLRMLNLRGNQLTVKSCNFFSKALHGNTTLCTLDLSHNQLTDEGLSVLCEVIEAYDHIKELHIENCEVTTPGCIRLAEALRANQSIAALYLSNNHIGDDGCEALAEMLMENCTLQTLYINLCSINRRGLHRMLVVISHDNYSLRNLGACYNNIYLNDDDVIQDGFEAVDIRNALNRALESNTERKITTYGKAAF